MTVLRWEEPPPQWKDRFAPIVAELQEHPGEWALIVEGVEISYAEQSVAKTLRRRGAQVMTRRLDGLAKVWACWPKAES